MTSLLDLPVLLDAVSGFCLGDTDFSLKRGFSSVATDSRNVKNGSLFVPLIGENQNGHIYIKSALEKGAAVVFVEQVEYDGAKSKYDNMAKEHTDVAFIVTKNNLHALQAAAASYVDKFPDLIRIGVTGSSGKTTTKEILVSILSQKYKVIANEGNLNSETGLPLSVFNIRKEHEVGVFEMGMNRVDEIGELSHVLRPKYAVVTNIGTAHIGILGSRENIANEKKKIFSQFDDNCFAFIPEDDDFCSYLAENTKGKVIKYGADSDNRIIFEEDCGLKGSKFSVDGLSMILGIPGIYNYRNACAAVNVALSLGLTPEEIKKGVEAMKTIFGRCEVLNEKYTIIQDCYNANPDSMEKAIDFCSSVKYDGKKIFVLGDMLELGADSKAEHAKIGNLALHSSADVVIFVGDEMKNAYDSVAESIESLSSKKILYFSGRDNVVMQKICDIILRIASNGDLILLKASRGMGLERLTKLLLGK